ncbi:MAG: phosphoglycerate dehydrogenase [bacterium]|nr:phosphoglycerate dehydrogenase [bacterium]
MKVLITDKINEAAAKIVEEVAQADILPTMDEEELCKVIGEYDALLVRSQTKVTPKVIEAASNMKIIGRAGVGVDNIDLDAATKKGIIVVNSPDGNTNAAAEHTIAMMMAMSRNIPVADASVKQGLWERSKFTGVEVFNKTLGVIGFGKIGQHVARAALAMGMKLVVNDPYTTKEYVEKFGGKYIEHLDDFWGLPDFITIHTPKTKETTSLINTNTINRMKKGVRIINCARCGIIDEAALAAAIEQGQVAGAAIDVYEDEKNVQNSPLIKLGRKIVLTPHLGASTDEAQINVALDVASQVKEVLSGGDATSAVNIPALKPQKLEPVKEYMPIAESIAKIASQTMEGNLRGIEIEVKGTLANLDVSPLEVAVLKGILSTNLVGVNYVNAPFIAKQRGINVTVKKSQQTTDYIGSITTKLLTDKGEIEVAGALIAPGVERIVKLNNYITSIEPDNFMLLVPHKNKPNMIGQVASVLGCDNVNISKMQVAQKHSKDDDISLMIINTDDVVDISTLEKIEKINGIENPKFIKL